MAQIKKVGESRYRVRVYAGRDSKGRRRYPCKTITGSRRQAERYARDLETKRDMGALIGESKMTLDEYLKQWLKTQAHEVRLVTLDHYQRMIDHHIAPKLGHKPLSKLYPYEIQEFYVALMESGLGAGTVRNIHATLGKALKRAVRLRLLVSNPVRDVDPPSYKPSETQSLTPEEAARFLEAAKGDEHYLLFKLALHTGLRPEEYLGLKWQHVQLDYKDEKGVMRGLLRVRQTVVVNTNGNGWYWSTPKTRKGLRDVFFPHDLAQELKSHRARQNELKLKLGRHYQDNDLVFTTRTGAPHRRINVSRRHFKPILKKAEIPERRLYCLRHSYATLSLVAGVDPKVVSEQMGHASIAFTLGVYHHVMAGMRETGADKLEKLISGTLQAQRAASNVSK